VRRPWAGHESVCGVVAVIASAARTCRARTVAAEWGEDERASVEDAVEGTRIGPMVSRARGGRNSQRVERGTQWSVVEAWGVRLLACEEWMGLTRAQDGTAGTRSDTTLEGGTI
jgi:hypothetical protein